MKLATQLYYLMTKIQKLEIKLNYFFMNLIKKIKKKKHYII